MPHRPNIVICSCDQLRAFEVGCYGNPLIRTPNIDRLAGEGVRFEIACSNNPLCTPSRANLLSGQYSRTCNGMTGNTAQDPEPLRNRLRDTTIAEAFRDAGYRTGHIGAWHVHPPPNLCGFEYSMRSRTSEYSAQTYSENGCSFFTADGWAWDFEMNTARAFIAEHRGEPFFLYFNIDPPHMPVNDAPEKYTGMYRPEDIPLRRNVDHSYFDPPKAEFAWSREKWFKVYLAPTLDFHGRRYDLRTESMPPDFTLRHLAALYYGMVTLVDEQVGKLLATLEHAGIAENTIVLFTSDHGDILGSHGLFNKLYLIEESIRIPMIYRWPAGLPRGRVAQQVTGRIDILPTLLALAGLSIPPSVQGTDVSPVVRGEFQTIGENAAYIETGCGGFGIRTRDFVYGIKPRNPSLYEHKPQNDEIVDDRYLFYDLRNDPYQLRNLAKTDALSDVAEDLRRRAIRWHESTPWLSI